MWLFASAIVVCFTIIAMFFLLGKLLESKWRHERLMQSDISRNAKYHAITQRPAPRPALPDFGQPVRRQNPGRSSAPFIDPRMTELMAGGYVRTWKENELPEVPTLDELREAEQAIRRQRRTL